MARAKKSVDKSVIQTEAETYAMYMDDPEQSTEDFISGIEWICDKFGIEIIENV
jgi:hypothetical protein